MISCAYLFSHVYFFINGGTSISSSSTAFSPPRPLLGCGTSCLRPMLRSPRRSSRLRCGRDGVEDMRIGGRGSTSVFSTGMDCAGGDGDFVNGCSKLAALCEGEAGVSY